jgi:hypothetical protein
VFQVFQKVHRALLLTHSNTPFNQQTCQRTLNSAFGLYFGQLWMLLRTLDFPGSSRSSDVAVPIREFIPPLMVGAILQNYKIRPTSLFTHYRVSFMLCVPNNSLNPCSTSHQFEVQIRHI